MVFQYNLKFYILFWNPFFFLLKQFQNVAVYSTRLSLIKQEVGENILLFIVTFEYLPLWTIYSYHSWFFHLSVGIFIIYLRYIYIYIAKLTCDDFILVLLIKMPVIHLRGTVDFVIGSKCEPNVFLGHSSPSKYSVYGIFFSHFS